MDEGQDDQDRKHFVPWAIEVLNQNKFEGFLWINKRRGIFQVPWRHKSSKGWDQDTDLAPAIGWAKNTGLYSSTRDDPKRMKLTFRCAMQSKPELKELREMKTKKYRFWQLKLSKKKTGIGKNGSKDKTAPKQRRHQKKGAKKDSTPASKPPTGMEVTPPVTPASSSVNSAETAMSPGGITECSDYLLPLFGSLTSTPPSPLLDLTNSLTMTNVQPNSSNSWSEITLTFQENCPFSSVQFPSKDETDRPAETLPTTTSLDISIDQSIELVDSIGLTGVSSMILENTALSTSQVPQATLITEPQETLQASVALDMSSLLDHLRDFIDDDGADAQSILFPPD